MPFDAKGTKIIKKATGKVVGHARSPEEARAKVRVRNAIIYGRGKSEGRKGPARQSRSSY